MSFFFICDAAVSIEMDLKNAKKVARNASPSGGGNGVSLCLAEVYV